MKYILSENIETFIYVSPYDIPFPVHITVNTTTTINSLLYLIRVSEKIFLL